MAKTIYKCMNKSCSLGTVDQPGLFTDGLSKEGARVLGVSEDKAGKGVCPNCGQKGKAT